MHAVFIEDQAKVLSERFDVLVLVQRTYGWREVLRGRTPAPRGLTLREGVRVYEQSIFLPPKLPFRAEMAYRFERARAAVVAIARDWGKPDIIHPHVVLPSGWIGAKLGRALNLPVVLTEHSGPFSSHLTPASHRNLVEETLQSCTKVIAVGPSLSDHIREVNPSLHVEILGDVIPTRFFRPAEAESGAATEGVPLRLFSAARLVEEKGYEHLLRAARILLDGDFPCFELAIGGDGPDRPRLEALISDLGLQRYCSMLGTLKRDELRDWMQRCDLFVLPSLAETFGVVIGEAMACGKPVLATHCGGADFQLTRDTGILVEPANAHALAQGIRRLAAARSEYSPARIRETVVERFGEAAFLDGVARIYTEALKEYEANARGTREGAD